jgi:hypothetical protein
MPKSAGLAMSFAPIWKRCDPRQRQEQSSIHPSCCPQSSETGTRPTRNAHCEECEIDSSENHAMETIVIANNHYKGQAVVNGLQLKKLLGEKDVKAPEELAMAYPRLKKIVCQPEKSE